MSQRAVETATRVIGRLILGASMGVTIYFVVKWFLEFDVARLGAR